MTAVPAATLASWAAHLGSVPDLSRNAMGKVLQSELTAQGRPA